MTTGSESKRSDESYAGDVTPQQAHEALVAQSGAALVDVRTVPEWSFVGTPDLSAAGKKPILIEWQSYPAMTLNPAFAEQVKRAGITKGKPIFFLCRSGARSRAAAIAMTQMGYGPCYNIAGGFEGARDAGGRRGTVEGWKAAGLPWRQD
jgi:rhodanese-related sulfurtransferase